MFFLPLFSFFFSKIIFDVDFEYIIDMIRVITSKF
jgi:hypothetical protein